MPWGKILWVKNITLKTIISIRNIYFGWCVQKVCLCVFAERITTIRCLISSFYVLRFSRNGANFRNYYYCYIQGRQFARSNVIYVYSDPNRVVHICLILWIRKRKYWKDTVFFLSFFVCYRYEKYVCAKSRKM